MSLDRYDGEVPGAAVGLLRGGRLHSVRCRGLARLEERTPVEPGTNFRLASITKQFTAGAIALLVEDGALTLDAPIREILPELPRWGDDICIGHLIAHTSGIIPYETLIPPTRTTSLTDRDVLHLLAAGPAPAFPPGARFEYDNGGYALLALAVEAIGGRSFGEFLESSIFRPLGMSKTVAHTEGRTVVRHRAYGYRTAGQGWMDADQGVATAVLGDGGIYSSLEDLARWDAALYEPGWLSDPAALAPFAAPVGPGVAYGFGWFLDALDGRRRQRHEGWSTGFQNEIQRFPDERLTVIVLTNRAEPPVRDLAEALARA